MKDSLTVKLKTEWLWYLIPATLLCGGFKFFGMEWLAVLGLFFGAAGVLIIFWEELHGSAPDRACVLGLALAGTTIS